MKMYTIIWGLHISYSTNIMHLELTKTIKINTEIICDHLQFHGVDIHF